MKHRFSFKILLLLGLTLVGVSLAGGVAHAQEETFAQGELAQESGGNFSATNTSSTAIGGYQMTEAALASAGYITINGPITAADDNGNMSNVTWTGQGGITSESQFLASPAAQTAAFNTYAGQTWSADQNLGISNDVGQTVGGQTLNQSAILGGSYLLGAGGMQSYVANGGQVWETASGAPCSAGSAGCTFNASLTQNAQSYIANASQEDSSAITGADATVAESAAGSSGASGSGSASSLYCASSVATLLQQGSLQYVQQKQALVTNPASGFTLLNGNSIAQAAGLSGGASSIGGAGGSYGEFSCLTNLLGGGLNMLFEPPNLSALLQALVNQVCAAGEQMVQNLVQPVDSSLFQSTNLGGFFPGMSLPNLGGGISTSFTQNGSTGISVSGLGGSTSWYGAPTSISPPTYFTNLLESP